MQWMLAIAVMFGCAVQVQAQLHTEAVEYRHGEAVLEGYLAYDDASTKLRPGILVVHEWKGLNEYAKRRARELAELGYVAFAIDMYGKGILAADHAEAGRLSGMYRSDRRLMRDRARAGLDVLTSQPLVDKRRVAAIGYCFGGTTVLELARDGADLAAVVSFHGSLSTPHPEDAAQIKGKVLVLQGGNDSFTLDEVPAFEQEMKQAGVDYLLVQYEGAVHIFTVPDAGNDPSTGVAYNAEADQQSWEEMKRLFQEVFGVQ
ncbi:MAG: dienelactone hydrolase family protein [Candidatus Omnitrophota bacterium]|nr:dienelactone hydrolase family protein [Candidatus Omnitrophota bacterium]